MGCCAGFTPQGLVHEAGELLAFRLTPGHGDDRKPGLASCRSPGASVRVSGAGNCPRRTASATPPHALRRLVSPVENPSSERHGLSGVSPALLLIRGPCARHDGLPGPLSGTSFANTSSSAGDCQTSRRPRASGPHAFLLLRWGGTGEMERWRKGTGTPPCTSVPM
jgi:hypothetical protein